MRNVHRLVSGAIAIFAVLMVSLAPTITRVFAADDAAAWNTICTSAGAQQIAADGDADGRRHPPAGADPLGHCPYCSLHADSLPAPLVGPAWLQVILEGPPTPAARQPLPESRDAWPGAQPRAPPSPTRDAPRGRPEARKA